MARIMKSQQNPFCIYNMLIIRIFYSFTWLLGAMKDNGLLSAIIITAITFSTEQGS